MVEKSTLNNTTFITLGNDRVYMENKPHILGRMLVFSNIEVLPNQTDDSHEVVLITKTLESALILQEMVEGLVYRMRQAEADLQISKLQGKENETDKG